MKLKILLIVTLCFCSSILSLARAFNPDTDGGKYVQVRTTKHRVRRQVRTVTFEIDDKDYHFNFEPSQRRIFSGNTPVWLVKSKPGISPNYTYERVSNAEQSLSNGQFYVDNAKKAVVFVRYDEKSGDIIYDGLFGENENVHLITSLPESQKYKLERTRQQQANHVIHKIQGRNRYILADAEEDKRSKRSVYPRVDPIWEKLDKPLDVLHPKLLVLVDHELFKYQNKDIAATIKYVATFWNVVDQKYVEFNSELDSPKVELTITGIIIADDETAFNYVHMSRLNEKEYGGKNRVHTPWTYEYMRKYFHYNFSNDVDFQNYDAAVLMIALDARPYVGITQLGKICGDWYNDMIVYDEGWFGGIHTATHELAHALGAEHDIYKKAGECQSHNDNKGVSVMSPVGDAGDYFFWSDCTKKYLRNFATTKAAECLGTRYRRERRFDQYNDW